LIYIGENAISYHNKRFTGKDNRPLVQDWRRFLKAQPLVCDSCGTFTSIYRTYCESCGTKYSLRKSKKKDFIAYMSKRESQKGASDFVYTSIQSKVQETKSIPLKSEITNVETFIKEHPYICANCWEFYIKETAYCVNCGSKNSLRKAKTKFFSIYQERREQYLKSLKFVRKPISKPVRDLSTSEFVKTQETSSAQDKWKEKINDISTPKREEITKSTEVFKNYFSRQLDPTENIFPESVQENSQELKPISSVPLNIEESIEPSLEISQPDEIIEKPKRTVNFCKFCGLQLAELDKFCQQCGYIIKQK
jgi:predicted amidophosphoribosyltransferase